MKRNIKKLQLQKKTIAHLDAQRSVQLNAGAYLAASRPLNCGPTQLCVTINVCPTTTMPTANCPGETL